ncbi:MAG TPA: NAD(P)(+) transhydrogenase (Re/Si-specific) subunit beta [Thermodesulfobacteriota bacterium]|nr:NAD(P)(+) transhydrogenase (Re/Si-specific) subunit beta [Thermodesulfobacteriota bacterium]
MTRAHLIELAYLLASSLFILGLKRLSSPATARSGNYLAAVGMAIAIVAALLNPAVTSYRALAVALAAGAVIGTVMARTVRMTAMPQMVALLNGFGGAASALVGWAEYDRILAAGEPFRPDVSVTIVLSLLVGAVTFTGSVVAWAKLQEVMTGRPITYPLQHPINLVLFLVIAALGALVVAEPTGASSPHLVVAILAAASVLGVLLVIPIGGADMPVVISLLNSYSGIAAAMTGFVLDNHLLIVAGALVGASGIILTQIMCKAMNRSLANVLFGAFGQVAAGAGAAAAAGGSVRSISPEDAAVMLAYARSVIVVPGYGMAVAQAQHAVRELADSLGARGVEVKYAIHPVAGRMPGHMNVLLAEANVPYDQLKEMDEINPEFERTDVALVVGANDVVNPAARNTPGSPIYGMPILNADRAKSVIVLKRSMRPGFAGIDNELFLMPNCYMLFGDARDSLAKVTAELKNV